MIIATIKQIEALIIETVNVKILNKFTAKVTLLSINMGKYCIFLVNLKVSKYFSQGNARIILL